MVRGGFASVGPAIDAVHLAGVVEGEAGVLGGDGFQVAGGLDVQGALEAAGSAFFFAEDEGEIGAGAGASCESFTAPMTRPEEGERAKALREFVERWWHKLLVWLCHIKQATHLRRK